MSFGISVSDDVALGPARRGLRCRFRSPNPTFSYWSTIDARRHHLRGGGPVPELAQLGVWLRPGGKGDALREAHRLEEALTRQHLTPVPTVGPAEMESEEVDDAAVRAELRSQALFGRGGQVWGRQRARRSARRAAVDEAGARRRQVATDHDTDREEADSNWAALQANDPAAVLGALEATFDLDDVPAAPVAMDGDDLAVVVRAPGVTAIPEHGVRWPRRGKPALVERSEEERAAFALRVLASQSLAVVRRAGAAAPGIRGVRVLAVCASPAARTVDAVYAGAFDVASAERWVDPGLEPVTELDAVPGRLLASTEAPRPLDLASEPEVDRVVKEVAAALFP